MSGGILEDREKRYNRILELSSEFRLPVLCGKLNYPGNDKNTPEAKQCFNVLLRLICDSYCSFVRHIEIINGFDGSSVILALNMNGNAAKRTSILLEETHSLGRIFDIDIYDIEGEPISRTNFNCNSRECLLCEDDAKVCNRSTKHSIEELLIEINKRISKYGEQINEGINLL